MTEELTGVIEDYNYFLWKKGIIYFDDETVAEMIKKLELYFDYKIEIKNKKLIRYKFSGKFNAKDGVEHVLRVLQLKHKFKYEKDEEHKIIVIISNGKFFSKDPHVIYFNGHYLMYYSTPPQRQSNADF